MADIEIARIGTETLRVPIIGTMPLIVHNFSAKAKRQMLDAQQGRKSPKEARDPQSEYEAAFYRTKDGYGFPVTAFKAATVGAARFYGKDVQMTSLRQFIFHARRDQRAGRAGAGADRRRAQDARGRGAARRPVAVG